MQYLIRVDGVSMSPTLDDGDYAIVLPLVRPAARGDVVVLSDTRLGLLVKRVTSCKAGVVEVTGESSLSASLGPFPPEAICGRVWLRISRRHGISRLPRSPIVHS